jgi:hypothetical protein
VKRGYFQNFIIDSKDKKAIIAGVIIKAEDYNSVNHY